jgi:hypothetical protein
MAYSTPTEAKIALANALTSGNPAAPGPQPITDIQNTLTATIPVAEFLQYIRWADQEIDAALSGVYKVPLKRVNVGTFSLAVDVTAGDGLTPANAIVLKDATRFLPDDVIYLRDSISLEELVIASVLDEYRITVTTPAINSYLAVNSRVERIRYPDPIPLVSAKMAAAHLYDKYFAAQVDGNKSEYGVRLRQDAVDDLNNVLSGTVRLLIADANVYTGRRYYNAALDDAHSTRAEPKEYFKRG